MLLNKKILIIINELISYFIANIKIITKIVFFVKYTLF